MKTPFFILFVAACLCLQGQIPDLLTHPDLSEEERSLANSCSKDSSILFYYNNNAPVKNTKTVYRYDQRNDLIEITEFGNYSPWYLKKKTTRQYNSAHKNTYQLKQYEENGTLVNDYVDSLSYDSQNNLIRAVQYQWDEFNNLWTIVYLRNYTYDASNRLVTRTQSSGGTSYKETFVYNSNNQTAQWVQQYLEPTTNTWANHFKMDYVYDIFGNILEVVLYTGQGGVWTKYSKQTSAYSGNLVTLNEGYVYKNNSWKKAYKNSYTYANGSQLTSIIRQNFDSISNAWINVQKYVYTYSGNNLVSETFLTGDPSNNWQNSEQDLYTYDQYGNRISETHQYWQMGNGWVNHTTTDIYFNCTTVGTEELTGFPAQVKIYPNPATNFLVVDSQLEFNSVKIIDISGKLVYSENFSRQLEVSSLEKGIYLIQLLDLSGRIYSSKFVKE